MDASEFIVGDGKWSGSFSEYPVMAIDDGESSSNAKDQARYTQRLKRIVANYSLQFSQKFKADDQVEWIGRIVVTMNDDPDSLGMLPDLQKNLLDKILIFQMRDPGIEFPRDGGTDRIIREELPHLMGWLLDWEVPAKFVGQNRFGVPQYCASNIRQDANETNTDQVLVDVLQLYFAEYKVEHPQATSWCGRPVELKNEIDQSEAISRGLTNEFSAKYIGHVLTRLAGKGYKIHKLPRGNGGARYEIQFNIEPTEEDNRA